jgi:hypothetical protein
MYQMLAGGGQMWISVASTLATMAGLGCMAQWSLGGGRVVMYTHRAVTLSSGSRVFDLICALEIGWRQTTEVPSRA